MSVLRALIAFVIYRCLFLSAGAVLPPVPSIEGHLTDPAKKLSVEGGKAIDERLGQIQQECKVDFAIFLLAQPVDSLRDMGASCFSTWSIGKSWEGGGALLVVSSDLKDCCLITSGDDSPFPSAVKSWLESSTQESLGSVSVERAIARVVERARRQLWVKFNTYSIPPPYDPNPLDPMRGATPYLWGIAAVIAGAGISRKVRKWH